MWMKSSEFIVRLFIVQRHVIKMFDGGILKWTEDIHYALLKEFNLGDIQHSIKFQIALTPT